MSGGWDDHAAQRVAAFERQFSYSDDMLLYRHRGVGPAYKVSAERRLMWTEAFSDKVHRSYRRIMIEGVIMSISLIISIRLFGDAHAGMEYAIGVAHLMVLGIWEWRKEQAAWDAPLADLIGHPALIGAGGHDTPASWFDQLDGMAAQSTPKLLLGVGMGSMITLSAMSPNAANLYNIGGVDPHIVAAVVGAFGGLIALLALLTLIRRWHKR